MLRIHQPILDSTNDRARRLAQLNAGVPLVVSADQQTAGRGRVGRSWASPVGGAWFTLAWPVPAGAEPALWQVAPLVAGLGLLEAIESLPAVQVRRSAGRTLHLQLKWPNDLLLNGRKLAGLLCESTLRPPAPATGQNEATHDHTPPPPAPLAILIGVGLNANVDPALLPAGLRYPATSLRAELAIDTDLASLISHCATAIAGRLDHLAATGFSADLRRTIADRLAWRGQHVSAHSGTQPVEGRLIELDAAGNLVLDTATGPQSLPAGELHGLTPAPERERLCSASARLEPVATDELR